MARFEGLVWGVAAVFVAAVFVAAVLVAMALVAGCTEKDTGSAEGRAGASCEAALARLRSCGLLSAGSFSCSGMSPCEGDCYAAASCEELRDDVCSTGSTEDSAFGTCVDACFGVVHCGDRTATRCDGEATCSDGSDEARCQYFDCGSGERLPADWECDHFVDCEDGSDEAQCGYALHRCADGNGFYVDSDRCDQLPFCDDGSDEAGCSYTLHSCDDDSGTYPELYRCDQEADCADGSDEEGCAQIVCE